MSCSTRSRTSGKLQWAMETINLFILCDKIYKLKKLGAYYYSPLRNDGRNPAFAIREDGEVGIDHGTGAPFNAITLIERVENLSRHEARTRLIHYADTYVPGQPGEGIHPRPRHATTLTNPQELVSHLWPFLEIGSQADYLHFARLRGLDPMALIDATAFGLFHFFTDRKNGQRLCTVTDSARYVRQDRSVTGEEVALSAGGTAKTRSIGKATWPVGAADIGSKPVVLLAEGMPDLLAAIQVISSEDRHADTAAVAMLGAGKLIHPQALPLFAGKRVRIFPDNDPAGLQAGGVWQRQLEEVGAEVDRFSMSAQEQSGRKPIKDLNDFVTACGVTCDGRPVVPAFGKKEEAQ